MRTAGVEPAKGKAPEVANLPRIPIPSRPLKMRPRVLATLGRIYLSKFIRVVSSGLRPYFRWDFRTHRKTAVLRDITLN